MPTQSTLNQLKVYVQAHGLERKVFALVEGLDNKFEDIYYPLGNSIWRATTATAHYIAEAHERYSYTIKIQSLQYGRISAEDAIARLEELHEAHGVDVTELQKEFTAVVKQCWDLIKYLQGKQREKYNLPATAPAAQS